MWYYIGITYLLFFLRYSISANGDLQNRAYISVLVSLFLFSAFRYQVGCDWSGYYFQYIKAAEFNLETISVNREPLWWLILRFLSLSELPYPVINIISSAIFFVGIHVLARRQPDPLGFLILLFPILIINMPMSGIRQGAAIGLLCIAFVAIIDRRPLSFAFWIVIATGFHSSALAFVLLLPVVAGRYTRKRLILTTVLAVPGAYFLASGDAADVATSRYIGTGLEAAGALFRVGLLGLSSLYFLMFVRKKWMQVWPEDYNLASIGAISMALLILLVPVSSVIGDRFGYYLIPIQAMIFARLPFLPFRANAALHAALPYLGLLLVFTVWSQLSWHFNRCYIPYQTWLFGLPESDFL